VNESDEGCRFVQQLNRGELHGKEKFARLKEAYDVLSDSSSRGEYDRQLGLVTKGSDASLPSYVRFVTPTSDGTTRSGNFVGRFLSFYKNLWCNMEIGQFLVDQFSQPKLKRLSFRRYRPNFIRC